MAKLVSFMALLYFSVVVGLRQADVVRINPALSVVKLKSETELQPAPIPEDPSTPVYAYENNTWYCVKNCPAFTGK